MTHIITVTLFPGFLFTNKKVTILSFFQSPFTSCSFYTHIIQLCYGLICDRYIKGSSFPFKIIVAVVVAPSTSPVIYRDRWPYKSEACMACVALRRPHLMLMSSHISFFYKRHNTRSYIFFIKY